MTPLERITQRVNRNGDVDDAATPRPLLTLEEFFEGNTLTGSICCNCTPTPEPGEMYDLLKRIYSRSDVADVRVQITMLDDPDWPFNDTAWVVTSAGGRRIPRRRVGPHDVQGVRAERRAPSRSHVRAWCHVQQCLNAGLLDEIHVDVAAVLLGSGIRLFDHLAGTPAVLGNPMVIPGVGVTHLRYPVRKA